MYRFGMNTNHGPPNRLDDMPLWRLLVLLVDLEREVGASAPTTRLVARIIKERLEIDDEAATTTQQAEAVNAP